MAPWQLQLIVGFLFGFLKMISNCYAVALPFWLVYCGSSTPCLNCIIGPWWDVYRGYCPRCYLRAVLYVFLYHYIVYENSSSISFNPPLFMSWVISRAFRFCAHTTLSVFRIDINLLVTLGEFFKRVVCALLLVLWCAV